jgi:hypothetical protein
MNVLLVQIDGKMPNLALMRIAAHHRERGDTVQLEQLRRERGDARVADMERGLFDQWDRVYASLIFTKSQPIARRLLEIYPHALVGGTGWNFRTLADTGISDGPLDYSIYPSCRVSIGFSQRGCRLNCGFCVVPQKEGGVRDTATVGQVWRGNPWPREVILLDNDFFGSPTWRSKIEEMRAGKFKVSLSQGINARMLSDEAAAALASIDYRDDSMERKRIYTAWDSLGDEGPLFRGLRALVKYGVKPDHIMVYMLVGYDQPALCDADFARHRQLREFGCRPYPMPYVRTPETVGFQRWVIGAYDKRVPWAAWREAKYRPEKLG